MNLFCLTIVFVVLIIQTYTDAVFVAPFGHHGHPSHHPMKPHFFGPPMHGPHIAYGPPIAHGFPPHMIHGHSPMLGPPMHPPFHLPRSHMGLPVPSMKPHFRHGSHDHPMHAMQKRVFHPLPHKYPKKTMIKALKHKKLYKKPRRVLLIRQRNGINMPNTNEYQRQMNRVAQSMYERGINYNNNYEINRYNNNNYIYNNYNNNNNIGRLNFNDRSFRNQGGNNANSPQFNARNWDIVTNGGNPGRHGNNFGNNRDLYPPRLREVVDSSNRVEISKNSLKSKHVSGSARKQSSRRSKERNNSNSLSGNTIDLTGSTFKSPNNNIGRDILSSNYLDKSSSGVQIERVNIRHDQIKSGTKRTDISSKVTRLNSNNRNNNHNRNRNNSDRLNNNNRNNNNRSKNNSNRLSNNNSNKSNTKNSNNRLNNNNVNNKGKGKNINGKNNLNKSKNSNTKNSNNNNNKNIGQQNNTNNKSNHKNNNVNKNNSHRNSKNNNNNNARKSKNNNSINKKSNTNKSNSQNNNKNKNNNNVNLSGLAGSLIDFSSMGVDASATNQNKMMNTQNSAHNTLSDKSNLSGSGTFAASSSLANSDVANNVAISSVADLNGNSINSAGNLLGASDLLLIDSNGLTPAEVAATALPIAGDALSGVVDLSTAGGNTNRIGGTNFDILTLDKGAFAQLEHALQTGQAINAKLLDSIISGGGTANNGGAFTASLASPSTAGVTDPGLAAPQIIILDHAQAQHLTGSAGIGGPQIVDLHSSSSSSKSARSSKQASSASTSSHSVEVPHAGKVLPAGSSHLMPGSHAGGNSAGNNHGHGIVGILGEPIRAITMGSNADLMGLFSMPDASNLSNIPESVVSIPESIGRRMPSGHQHSGMTDMSSIQGSRDHRMPAGHTSHSSHSAHCKIFSCSL